MRILTVLSPITFVCSLIAGLIGITNIAYLFLEIGTALVFAFIGLDVVTKYILIPVEEDNEDEYFFDEAENLRDVI